MVNLFPSWLVWDRNRIYCACNSLPKQSFRFNLIQRSRQHELRAYWPNIYTVPSSVMEVNRISKQTLGSYRFACLFPLLACPILTMILHILTLSNLTEFVFVKDLFWAIYPFCHVYTEKVRSFCYYGPEIFLVCTHEEKYLQIKITFLSLLD